MKIAVIIDWGTRKDLVDLYDILQVTAVEEIFQIAAIKYAHVHSFPISAIRAMAFFTDAEKLPMPHLIDRTSWSKMKKFLEQQAVEIGRSQLTDLWK
jgi:hypothetical protein